MISLKNLKPFASGSKRHCYIHPDDSQICLKLLRVDQSPVKQRQAKIKKGNFFCYLTPLCFYDENLHEYVAYKKIKAYASKTGIDYLRHIPKVHGYIETDLGQALMVELVRDTDNSISKNLSEFCDEMKSFGVRHARMDDLKQQFKQIFDLYFKQNYLGVKIPRLHNILVRQETNCIDKLYIIDNYAHKSMLIHQYLPVKLKTIWQKRRLNKLKKSFQDFYGTNIGF